MIDPSEVTFPNNIVMTLKTELQKIDPPTYDVDGVTLLEAGLTILLRPIRKGDPGQALGITAAMWSPDVDSYEFLGSQGRTGATINTYLIGIQVFVQDSEEARGLQTIATLSGLVRGKLSRDPDVRVALAMLRSTEFGYEERFLKSYIQGQRFLSNEIEGSFYHLSNLELIVETETN